jgi:macrolide transport system ATP-binding/permease protein
MEKYNNWKLKFYTIWAGQAVSLITSAILQMAIIFYLTEKTGSAMVLSMASLVGFLPYAVFGPAIGVLVDRHDRKKIMIGADLIIAAAGAVLAIVALYMELPIWMVMVVLFIRSIGTAFHTPALNAVTPLLVPEEQLTKCAGYSQSLQSISYIVSPAVAALLYSVWELNAIIGLVGANGAGKSTLFKVILGELTPPGCKMNRLGELAYIPQLDKVTLQEEKDFGLVGKLGVNQLDIQTMSGGEETRLKIAQALSAQVHGILADEPTSHLDREGIDFLIGQLKYFIGALLVISHDRYFLDEVVDKIWELKDGKITEYWGNYSDYLRQKEEERKSQSAEYEQFIAERARLERAAEEKRKQARKIEKKAKGASKKKSTEGGGRLAHQKSMGSKAKKMHNAAKSLEHRIAALGKVEAPEDIRRIRFRQSKALELHNPYPIAGTEINKIFGDKVLFENVSFQIPLGAKVALTGSNGTGKTTLIQMILNHEDGISISPKAKIGYFAQNGYKYNSNQNVLEFMQEDCDYNVSEIRSVLASMGVKQNDIGKSLSVLSGGEIIKLLLAKMLMGRYNILLMDEPSNFLDIPSLEALEILMKEYAGTIVFITHDKRLLDNVADVIYEIKDKKLNLVR